MSVDNSKYTDHRAIMASLGSVIKNRSIQEADVIEWCQECERNYIKDPMTFWKYMGIALDVENLNNTTSPPRARVPCNVIRILDVYASENDETGLRILNVGNYIHLPKGYTNTTVYLNFLGTPIDLETGTPLILKGHEEACKAFILKQIYYEDFLNGKIDANRFSFINEDFINKHRSARNSSILHKTRSEMEDVTIITMNMIRMIGDQKLAHNEWNN